MVDYSYVEIKRELQKLTYHFPWNTSTEQDQQNIAYFLLNEVSTNSLRKSKDYSHITLGEKKSMLKAELTNSQKPTTCIRRHFKYDFSVRRNRSTVILRYGSTHWSTCPLQFWKTTSMSFGAGSISPSSKFLSAIICINKKHGYVYRGRIRWNERKH